MILLEIIKFSLCQYLFWCVRPVQEFRKYCKLTTLIIYDAENTMLLTLRLFTRQIPNFLVKSEA